MPFTQQGKKLFVCATAQPIALSTAAAAALTWVEVFGVGNIGEYGKNPNMVAYNHMATGNIQRSKGLTDLGSPVIECSREQTLTVDPGVAAMVAAGDTNNSYYFKVELNDTPSSGASPKPTRDFLWGKLGGPTYPNGGVEDFELMRFTLAVNDLKSLAASAT
jgi:hypothetical protein